MIKDFIKQIKSWLSKSTRDDLSKPKYFLDRLLNEVQNFEVVFDVGAYHGQFTEAIINLNSNLTVHCFEPSVSSFKILEKTFSGNSKIHIVNAAVSDFSGNGKLNINSFNETNSLLQSADVSEKINLLTKRLYEEDVAIIRLDDYCVNNKIAKVNLIKIDTQGNSFKVLEGLQNLLKHKKIDYLYVETEFIEIYKSEKLFSEIEIFMRSFDYLLVDIYNLNYIENRIAWCDALFKSKNVS